MAHLLEKSSRFYRLPKLRYMQNEKVFQTFLIEWELTLTCSLFVLIIRKIIRTGQKEFNHTAFVELFTTHLLGENSRFYHLLKRRYVRNKKCYNTIDTLSKRKCDCFFLIDFLYFKLHLIFNVNIPKDAARSRLSRYI